MKGIVVVLLGLFACKDQAEVSNFNLEMTNSSEVSSVTDTISPDIFPDNCELMTTIYEMDTSMQDSSLHCTEYLFIDQSKSKEGKCHYRLPFEIEALSADFFELLKQEKSLETFDPTICEVGGHSAYNKYQLTENGIGNYTVLHYKAWYEDYTEEGEPITHEQPEYFLGEQIKIIEKNQYLKLTAQNEEGQVIESIENFYNENGILIRQKWFSLGSTFVSHFVYNF